jgi:serine/threonine-protein kinase
VRKSRGLLSEPHFVESTIRWALDVDDTGVPQRNDPQRPGIADGAAGVALFCLELHRLGLSDRALERAATWVRRAETMQEHDTREPGGDTIGVFFGRAGIAYVRALLAAESADAGAQEAAIRDFGAAWKLARRHDDPLDVFTGVPGFLLAVRDLLDRGIDAEVLRRIGSAAYERTIEEIGRPCDSRDPNTMLGVAHGLAGALMAAIRWDPAPRELRGALDEWLALASTGEGLILWPRTLGATAPDALAGSWCNGIAGFSLLLCQACAAFQDPRYAAAASAAAYTLAVLKTPNPTVCCGSAGQAIGLYRCATATKTALNRRRARARLRRAMNGAGQLEFELMQGRLGVALAAIHVMKGRTPAMPIFDPPA